MPRCPGTPQAGRNQILKIIRGDSIIVSPKEFGFVTQIFFFKVLRLVQYDNFLENLTGNLLILGFDGD